MAVPKGQKENRKKERKKEARRVERNLGEVLATLASVAVNFKISRRAWCCTIHGWTIGTIFFQPGEKVKFRRTEGIFSFNFSAQGWKLLQKNVKFRPFFRKIEQRTRKFEDNWTESTRVESESKVNRFGSETKSLRKDLSKLCIILSTPIIWSFKIFVQLLME